MTLTSNCFRQLVWCHRLDRPDDDKPALFTTASRRCGSDSDRLRDITGVGDVENDGGHPLRVGTGDRGGVLPAADAGDHVPA